MSCASLAPIDWQVDPDGPRLRFRSPSRASCPSVFLNETPNQEAIDCTWRYGLFKGFWARGPEPLEPVKLVTRTLTHLKRYFQRHLELCNAPGGYYET